MAGIGATLSRTLGWPGAITLKGALLPAASAAAASVLGVLVAGGYWYVAAAAAASLLALVVGLLNWRWAVTGLLAYIPVAGVLVIATYPNPAATLAKDVLFVIPAYAGFFGLYLTRRRRITFDGAPVAIMAMLALVVLLGAFNPAVPEPLVAVVGIRAWLFYMPLLFIGYHLIRDRDDLQWVLRLICLTALLPAVVGIVEAIFVYSGRVDVVHSWYGAAAAAATQGVDFHIDIGGAELRRIPSTFSFVAQYYVFTTVLVALAYAWWRGGQGRGRRWRAALWALMLIAAFTTGGRGAFVFIPMLLAFILILEGRIDLRSLGMVAAAVGGFLFMLALLGTDAASLIANLSKNAANQWDSVIVGGAKAASEHLFTGLGTGTDTNAGRHVVPFSEIGVDGVWHESWWVKSALELGIAGLALSVALYVAIIGHGLRRHRTLRDPMLRSTSAAILALLLWTAVYNFKGYFTDIDPLNVYFWLLSGILYKLSVLDRQASSRSASRDEDGGDHRSPSLRRRRTRPPASAGEGRRRESPRPVSAQLRRAPKAAR